MVITPKYKFFKFKKRAMRVAIICPEHGFKRASKCDECEEKESKRVEGANIHVWKPMWYEDICETPIYIESKRQLREECKKHNVIAARLL